MPVHEQVEQDDRDEQHNTHDLQGCRATAAGVVKDSDREVAPAFGPLAREPLSDGLWVKSQPDAGHPFEPGQNGIGEAGKHVWQLLAQKLDLDLNDRQKNQRGDGDERDRGEHDQKAGHRARYAECRKPIYRPGHQVG